MTEYVQEQLQNFLQQATEAALEGGKILKKHWGKLQHIRNKVDSGDLVTEADHESEAAVIGFLEEQFPDHGFLGEESGLQASRSADFLWAIDPLDGTTNYTHSYPTVAVSIGLLYRGSPIVGVVYNPITDELFQAAKGLGAMLNHQPIHTSTVATLNKSLLGTGFAYDRQRNPDTNYAEFCHITHISQGVRRAGAAALDLAYVAAGRLDGYWEHGIKIWDMAAGVIIVEEAGGKVSDYNQQPLDINSGRIVATNGLIHDALCKEILEVKTKINRLPF
ncbi:MAG: inositol monophosphatase family protein [Chlamydiales bacterium]|nr:inositol monophosphatase family protein [Chlamydiales bacterium]